MQGLTAKAPKSHRPREWALQGVTRAAEGCAALNEVSGF